MAVKEFNKQEALTKLNNYWGYLTPMGDWRHYEEDVPVMTKLVTEYFNVKVSKPTKLEFCKDVLTAMGDNNKFIDIATEKLRVIPTQSAIDVIRDLTIDTININSDTSNAALLETLRREYVSAQYAVAGKEPAPGENVVELNLGDIATPEILTKILSSLTSIGTLSQSLANIKGNMIRDIPMIGALIKECGGTAAPELYRTFRAMCSTIEACGVLKSVLYGLVDAASSISSPSQGLVPRGIEISDINQHNQSQTLGQIGAKVQDIAKVYAGLNNTRLTSAVQHILTNECTVENIEDVSSILIGSQIPLNDSMKYYSSLSTLATTNNIPNQLNALGVRAITALIYLGKTYADVQTRGMAGPGQVLQVINDMIGNNTNMTPRNPGYRISLAEAIQFDLGAGNANATRALAKVTNTRALNDFANRMLAANGASGPILTVNNLKAYINTVAPYNSSRIIQTGDIEGFMKSRNYIIPQDVPAFKIELLKSIWSACTGRPTTEAV